MAPTDTSTHLGKESSLAALDSHLYIKQSARVIDKSGAWWKGENFDDLTEFVIEFTSQNYRANEIRQSVCKGCGGERFGLWADDDEGCAERVCRDCGAREFVADSEEYWEDANAGDAACPCGAQDFQIAVGFSLNESGEINWISVGCRCFACGVLGVYVDWKVDYEPSRHLLDMV